MLLFYNSDLRQHMIDDQEMLERAEKAIVNEEFKVYLQPVCSITTGKIASAEALVRWEDPENGLISPGSFIPLFEHNGFISRLDYYMWEHVCQLLGEALKHSSTILPVSVNISRKSLYNRHLFDDIVGLVKKYGVDPKFFRIEITESAYMHDHDLLIKTVTQLQNYGFTILLDDFGSGYSSFNALKDIPVDILKIDMKFMEGFEGGGRVGAIVVSILRMARWLNLFVVAEGVETELQFDFLRTSGCDYVQGYLFSKPLSVDDYKEFVSSNPSVELMPPCDFTLYNIDDLMGSDRLFNRIMDSVVNAYVIYVYHDHDLEMFRASNGYFKLFDNGIEGFKDEAAHTLNLIHPDDRQSFIDAFEYVAQHRGSKHVDVRHVLSDQTYINLSAMILYVGYANNRYLCFTTFTVEDGTVPMSTQSEIPDQS